jgi:hypothetical protein
LGRSWLSLRWRPKTQKILEKGCPLGDSNDAKYFDEDTIRQEFKNDNKPVCEFEASLFGVKPPSKSLNSVDAERVNFLYNPANLKEEMLN